MLVYGLRVLVALITFGVGLAAASLLNFESPKLFERDGVRTKAVLVSVGPAQGEPPPPRSCSYTRVVAGGVLNGKAVSKPAPAYPASLAAAGIRGTVVVQLTVDEGGSVTTAEAISGPALLRDAAEAAAREARFSPTFLSGQPVKVSGVVTYNFGLR
jgi:TonB family protein